MAWECTTFLLGEYSPTHFEHPAYSIIDGIITARQFEMSGEQQRMLQVIKLRGTSHSRDEHPFVITDAGVEVYAPGITLRRHRHLPQGLEESDRMKTGISKLDRLLGAGIPRGSSIIIGRGGDRQDRPGTGVPLPGRPGAEREGALHLVRGDRGAPDRHRPGAGLGVGQEIDRGMVRILFIPQPDILVDRDLLRVQHHVEAFGARRVVVDSMSVFLHKVESPAHHPGQGVRLANIVQNQNAVGLFTNDIPAGTAQHTRFGVEETVMDGLILLSSEAQGLERHRYLEVNKLRNTGTPPAVTR